MGPARSRTSAVAAGIAALVLLATGCGSGGAGESGSDTSAGAEESPDGGSSSSASSGPAASPSVPVDDSDDYADLSIVTLGDSYTAAPGVAPIDEASGACLRSDVNYPHLLAGAYGGSTLADVSCSGATTADLSSGQSLGDGATAAPQLDAVTADTDVVTLSTGGNDFGAFGLLAGQCASGSCEDLDISSVMDSLAQVSVDLAAAIEEARSRAPQARILVVGYPQVAPADAGCDDVPLDGAQLPLLRAFNSALADAQRTAAEDADAEFVDMWAATEGHALCSDDPWINGLNADDAAPYHPLAIEQQAVAAQIIEVLDLA